MAALWGKMVVFARVGHLAMTRDIFTWIGFAKIKNTLSGCGIGSAAFRLVGDGGFEPPASTMSMWRSNR